MGIEKTIANDLCLFDINITRVGISEILRISLQIRSIDETVSDINELGDTLKDDSVRNKLSE